MNKETEGDEFRVGVGERFGFLAVPYPGDAIGLDEPFLIADGFWYLPKAPAQIDNPWRGFLGEASAEAFDRAPFWIVTTKEAPAAGRDPPQGEPLAATLHDFFMCLLMGGFPELGISHPAQSYEGTGLRLGDRLLLNTCRFGTTYASCHATEGVGITPDSLRNAVRRLPSYYRVCSGPGTPWMRICRGLHILVKAMQERYMDFRLHHYVQAIEAIIKPGKGDNTEQFKKRCRSFARESAGAGTILSEIYKARCAVEHMHGWTTPFGGNSEEHEARVMLRLWQVENLALHVYSRLMESEELLEWFRDDRIDAVWNAKPSVLDSLWLDKLDLESFEWKGKDSERVLGIRGYDPMQILLSDYKARHPAGAPPAHLT